MFSRVGVRRFGGAFLPRDEVTARVIEVVKKFPKIDENKVGAESHFVNDLGLDSLDTVELVMAFEDHFAINIPDEAADKIFTVADAVEYIAANPLSK